MTFFKSAATAFALVLATVTLADAATIRPAAAHSVAGKATGNVSVVKRRHVAHHVAHHIAHPVAKHVASAHRVSGTKVARTRSLRHVAENHRVSAKTSVVR